MKAGCLRRRRPLKGGSERGGNSHRIVSAPEELGCYISSEVVKWREIIAKGNIALE